MKILKKIFGYFLILVVLLILGLIIGIPIANNIVAHKAAKEVAAIPLPVKTEYIEKTSLAGKLFGCGNGMQYFGAILVKSKLDLEELQEYYSNYSSEEAEYTVEIQKSNEIDVIEHGSLSFHKGIDGEGYYIIYTVTSSNISILDMDLRGH